MEIKPIRSEDDHDEALREIERLWGAEAGTPEGDRLEVLVTLVSAWEEKHCPMAPPDPIEAIRFRMEQMGLTTRSTNFVCLMGGRNRVSEILGRRRRLSLAMIRNLHDELGIPADVLIQSYPIKPQRAQHPAKRRKTVASREP